MTTDLVLAILGAILVVAAGLYAIYRWGPGRAARVVHCPEKKVAAQVVLERQEGSFGALLEPDITACSLLPEGRVDCEKKCLAP